MRQVNVRLDEELIRKIKRYALDNDKTFQEVVKESLEIFVSIKIATNIDNNCIK